MATQQAGNVREGLEPPIEGLLLASLLRVTFLEKSGRARLMVLKGTGT